MVLNRWLRPVRGQTFLFQVDPPCKQLSMLRRFPFVPWGVAILTGLSICNHARGLEIVLDYSLDSNGFFAGPQSPQRQAMEAVADFFEGLISDELAEINPQTFGGNVEWSARVSHPGSGDIVDIPNLVVPKDTLVVYVGGGRNLGGSAGRGGSGGYSARGTQAWFDLISARGEVNLDNSPATSPGATDFGPWGGAITLDTQRTWNFSTTGREPDGSGGTDFVSIALHEFGHLLGLGASSNSWKTYTDTSQPTQPVFIGPASMAEYGGPIPMQAGGVPSHWQDDGACAYPLGHEPDNPLNVLSLTIGQFGTPADRDQIAIMDPSSCATADTRRVWTRLDSAALSDVGWTLSGGSSPATLPALRIVIDPSTRYPKVTWPSQLGIRYQLERSQDLQAVWTALGPYQDGDGNDLTVVDTNPTTMQFYRLRKL